MIPRSSDSVSDHIFMPAQRVARRHYVFTMYVRAAVRTSVNFLFPLILKIMPCPLYGGLVVPYENGRDAIFKMAAMGRNVKTHK